MGKHHTGSSSKEENEDHMDGKEETIQQILKHKNSAAALLCQITTQVSDNFLIKDVVGVVATLGKVNDANLSRLV